MYPRKHAEERPLLMILLITLHGHNKHVMNKQITMNIWLGGYIAPPPLLTITMHNGKYSLVPERPKASMGMRHLFNSLVGLVPRLTVELVNNAHLIINHNMYTISNSMQILITKSSVGKNVCVASVCLVAL